jgi:hypothetical protein
MKYALSALFLLFTGCAALSALPTEKYEGPISRTPSMSFYDRKMTGPCPNNYTLPCWKTDSFLRVTNSDIYDIKMDIDCNDVWTLHQNITVPARSTVTLPVSREASHCWVTRRQTLVPAVSPVDPRN